MKNLILILAFAASGFATVVGPGKTQVTCGALKNSRGYGSLTTAYAPWRLKVDTVFIDTNGTGGYKKLGTGVVNQGDTTKAVFIKAGTNAALGWYGFLGNRAASTDSGAFAVKPLCYSTISRSWITSKNMLCDTLNSPCDTLLTVPSDSAGFGIERYFPSYCDSMKVVVTVKGVTGRASDPATPTSVRRLGICTY